MKKVIFLSLFILSNSFAFLAFNQTATSLQSTTDNKDWIIKSGYFGSASPSKITLDGGVGIGGSVYILAASGQDGNGKIELSSSSSILLKGPGSNIPVKVGIGFDVPAEALHINGAIRGNSIGGALMVRTANGGYIELGSQTSLGIADIKTDADYFLFNRPISSPTNLYLQCNENKIMSLNVNGNVGIGTGIAIPQAKLHIEGSTYLPIGQSFWIGSVTDVGNRIRMHHNGTNAFIDFYPNLIFRAGANEALTLFSDGNIGIGTSNTFGHKLAVNGSIIATEVIVKLYSTWPDYVFGKDYHLKSLSEIENYIKENKHLPDVPSDTEVKQNGINVAEMNSILLKKVEELTLYIIEQEKRIRELELIQQSQH